MLRVFKLPLTLRSVSVIFSTHKKKEHENPSDVRKSSDIKTHCNEVLGDFALAGKDKDRPSCVLHWTLNSGGQLPDELQLESD